MKCKDTSSLVKSKAFLYSPSSFPRTSYKAYQDIIESTKGLVVVKIEAAGCRGCQWLAPGLEELAEKYAGQVVILTVDYMVVPELMWEFKCPKIPTLIIYKNGVVIDQFVSTDKNVVEERIQKAMDQNE